MVSKSEIGKYSIRLFKRDNPSLKCIMCGADNEDILHFFHSNKYPGEFITDIVHINTEQEDICMALATTQ